MKAAILGKKIGMTSLFLDNGEMVPCTVIEAGPCPIVQIKTDNTDGYSALQIGFGNKKEQNVGKPLSGHYKSAGVTPAKILREFRDPEDEYKLGQTLTVEQFNVGDLIRVSGKSKGKGFQGVVKRYNFAGVGGQTHGQKNRERHPGSIGQSSWPSRVLKGTRMGGRMGNDRVTVRNIEILEIVPDQNLLIVKGSIPGTRNSYVEIIK